MKSWCIECRKIKVMEMCSRTSATSTSWVMTWLATARGGVWSEMGFDAGSSIRSVPDGSSKSLESLAVWSEI
jgi:hypothetical protein